VILHHRALNRAFFWRSATHGSCCAALADLWGYDVLMKEIDPATESVLKEHAATPRTGILQSDGN
jgi:hypothetical protein